MDSDTLNSIGILFAIAMSVFSFFMNLSRARHQNMTDEGSTMKTIVETSTLTAKARLEAEKRAEKMDQRVAELEKLLNGMAYRVTFVVHTGEEPRIEKISVERFPATKLVGAKV